MRGESTQTTLTFSPAYVASCNYECCINSYNNVGNGSSTCISLRKEITLCHVRVNLTLIFHTAAVPGRPINVWGTVQSPQSVQILWSPPSTNYYHITGYQVSYDCPFCSSQSMDVNAVSRSLTINNLIQLATYTFNVKAESVAGQSSSSYPTVTLTIGKPLNSSWAWLGTHQLVCSLFNSCLHSSP